jgi:hypothetical protein
MDKMSSPEEEAKHVKHEERKHWPTHIHFQALIIKGDALFCGQLEILATLEIQIFQARHLRTPAIL